MSDVTLGIILFLTVVASVIVWKLFMQGEVVRDVLGTRDKADPSAEAVRLLVKRATARSGSDDAWYTIVAVAFVVTGMQQVVRRDRGDQWA